MSNRGRLLPLVAVNLILSFACQSSSDSDEPAAGAGGSNTGGSSAGKGGSAGGAGGSNTGGSSGGASGAAAGGGAAGQSSGGATGGGGGAGGAMGGAGGAMGGQGGGAPVDAGAPDSAPSSNIELAGKLHKYLRTLKCVRGNPDDMRRSCYASDEDQNRNEVIPFMGEAGKVYDVTIHFRGLLEPRDYTGGMTSPVSPWLYIGGQPGNRYAAYNVYKLAVSEPKQDYFFNRDHGNFLGSGSTDHDLHKIDFTLTIKVAGGATLDVVNADRPTGMNRNFQMHVIEGVPEDVLMQGPTGYDGQFFYMEVDKVVPAAAQ